MLNHTCWLTRPVQDHEIIQTNRHCCPRFTYKFPLWRGTARACD
jgi:hypothetical protein